MKMIDEYFDKYQEYKDKYGEKTFLLYQVGSFFEVYGIKINNEVSKHIRLFSEICGLAIAEKQFCIGKNNVVMAGFRDYLLDKYIEKIHPRGYTIVVYIQQEVDGTIIRKENGIYSPGTTFLDNVSVLSNNICCIWIQKTKTSSVCGEQYVFGLSNINIFNGSSNLCEYNETFYHNPTSYDTIEKFLNVYSPIETIIIHNLNDNLISSIIEYLQLQCKKNYIIDLNNNEKELSKQANNCENQIYQNEIIKKYFPGMNYEVFKYSIQDKPICLQSYCFLLNFISQHNVSLIDKICEPVIEQFDDILVCANHSLKQLNIIGENVNYFDEDGKISGVLTILNKCITKIGKRAMNNLILNPISNKKQLQQHYDNVEYIMKNKYTFDSQLRGIKDIEKILTKFKLNKATPSDIYSLYETSMLMKDIYNIVHTDKKTLKIFDLSKYLNSHTKFLNFIQKCLNIELCQSINNKTFDKEDKGVYNIVKNGYNAKYDNAKKLGNDAKSKLKSIIDYMEMLFVKKDNSNYIQQHHTPNNELCLLLTKKRSKTLSTFLKKEQCKEIIYHDANGEKKNFTLNTNNINFKDYNKQKVILCSEQIDKLVSDIFNYSCECCDLLCEIFQKINKKIYNDYYNFFTDMITAIKNIDVINTKIYLIKEYNLCKPKIVKSEDSFVDATKLRHILIETIEKNEIYVPNNISLGRREDDLGILLFGTNAVGKTSLIKALGISIIMAQCGLYVPCEKFEYSPYKYIFTRIIGNDNIFKGLSTFGVEMSELRVILNNCNNNSLILGDELCSGTETDSALSIFNASIEVMVQRKSNFIFATHFHELPHLKTMESIKSVSCKHLKVQFDNERQKMFYDRNIHDGQGDTVYGLEVCKSLKLPDAFIDRCYAIRNEYMNNKDNILLLKSSKYNKNKLRNICEFCNETLGTEIHHLQYQCDANKNEYIENSFHKNHNANLSSICSKCHNHVHSLNLRYEKRKSMDGGYELILKTKL